MKVILNKPFEPVRKYPFLGVHKKDGYIVLFSATGVGTVLSPTPWACPLRVGDISTVWGTEDFETYIGSITLENDRM